MKLIVRIKSIGDEQKGTSSRTGDEWRGRCLLLCWEEQRENGTWKHYHRVMAFGKELETVEAMLHVGDMAEVDLSFSSTDRINGYYRNETKLMEIKRVDKEGSTVKSEN